MNLLYTGIDAVLDEVATLRNYRSRSVAAVLSVAPHRVPLNRAYRILLDQFVPQALSLQRSRSRFSYCLSHAVLYAAMTFETAFIEVLV